VPSVEAISVNNCDSVFACTQNKSALRMFLAEILDGVTFRASVGNHPLFEAFVPKVSRPHGIT
jgi:hypothetical protein